MKDNQEGPGVLSEEVVSNLMPRFRKAGLPVSGWRDDSCRDTMAKTEIKKEAGC